MSRSNKKMNKGEGLKRDVRKDANRGFRRSTKLKIKAGDFELPEVPRSNKVNEANKE